MHPTLEIRLKAGGRLAWLVRFLTERGWFYIEADVRVGSGLDAADPPPTDGLTLTAPPPHTVRWN